MCTKEMVGFSESGLKLCRVFLSSLKLWSPPMFATEQQMMFFLIVNFGSSPPHDVLQEIFRRTLADATSIVAAVAEIRRFLDNKQVIQSCQAINIFQDVKIVPIDPELLSVPRVFLPAKEFFRNLFSRLSYHDLLIDQFCDRKLSVSYRMFPIECSRSAIVEHEKPSPQSTRGYLASSVLRKPRAYYESKVGSFRHPSSQLTISECLPKLHPISGYQDLKKLLCIV